MSDSNESVEITVAVKLRVRLDVPSAATAARMTAQDIADTITAGLPFLADAECVVAGRAVAGEWAEMTVSPWLDPIPADDEMDLADYSPADWPLLPVIG